MTDASERDTTKQSCFLCALDPHPCVQAQLTGRIVTAREHSVNGEIVPLITLDSGTTRISLALTRYYRSLVKGLHALGDAMRSFNITLHVYHLPTAPSISEYKGRPLHYYQANSYTLAVLEPDTLLNITDLNHAEYCPRQYLLHRLAASPTSAAAIRGTLVHTCFKELLKEQELTPEHRANDQETPLATLQRHLEQALERSSIDLALADVSSEAIRTEVAPHLESLATWYQNQRTSLWDLPAAHSNDQSEGESHQAGENVVRAETFLLAPEIGLKGRLDLLWQQSDRQRLLELKTGGGSAHLPKRDHRWQVYGYHALLTVRRDSKMKKALATLLYSGTPGEAQAFGIPFTVRDLQRVNETRNILALSHITAIPPPPPGPSRCTKCAMLTQCEHVSTLLNWEPPQPDVQDSIGDTDQQTRDPHQRRPQGSPHHPTLPPPLLGTMVTFPQVVSQTLTPENLAATLLPEDYEFFAKYYHLLQLEGRAGEQQQALLWKTTAIERIERGTAMNNLVPLGQAEATDQGAWLQTFSCNNQSELREGDEILLSDGDPITGEVVTGTIVDISAEQVTIWSPELIAHPTLIDRYGSDIVHVRTLQNLLRWLQTSPRMRELVAGKLQPQFNTTKVVARTDFNTEQNLAVERALQMQDYLLIHGPPGTGKTSVIAEIVKRLCQQGQRVLLAAFTNQAVDNMLKRLDKEGFHDYLRLGHDRSVADDVQKRLLKTLVLEKQPTPVYEILGSMPVVASTTATWSSEKYTPALHPSGEIVGPDLSRPSPMYRPALVNPHPSGGIVGPDLSRPSPMYRPALVPSGGIVGPDSSWPSPIYRPALVNPPSHNALQFDVAIIDEAGQLTVPAILGALRFAKRFILVGDEKQLPPLVLSKEAAEMGLAHSIFSQLKQHDEDYKKAHPTVVSACVPLRIQYRMHKQISDFASTTFYNGLLIPDRSVAHRVLNVVYSSIQAPAIKRAIHPGYPLVFLDVRGKQADEGAKISHVEARTVREVVRQLLMQGIAEADIGIIAPFRAQVANLRRHLFSDDPASGWQALNSNSPLSIDTVDRFQGGERLVIIMSFATITAPAAESVQRDFLTNPNRLNVALTRAQRKLILVGCAPALAGLPIFRRLLSYCQHLNTLIPYAPTTGGTYVE